MNRDREHETCIRKRAHELWREAGSPEGQDLQHWLEAERELSGRASDPLGFPDRPHPPGEAEGKLHGSAPDDMQEAEPAAKGAARRPAKKGF